MSRLRSFNDEQLVWLREMPLIEVLKRLSGQGHLFWRCDADFKPEQDKRTQWVYVSLSSGRTWELLVTGCKWFDTRAQKGGGGIDLVMYLFGMDFVSAVKFLCASLIK